MFRFGRSSSPASASDEETPRDPEAEQDERLIRAAQRGDLPSFNALVTRHERAVYGLCLRMLREPSAAEDATQDTFFKAWTAVKSWNGGLVRPWLMRIATNRCLDLLRARSRRPVGSLDAEVVEIEPVWSSQAPPGEEPERFATRRALSSHLEHALAQLPDDQRIVCLLSDVHGMSYEEISTNLDLPIGTVKSRLNRSRAKLRELLMADAGSRELLERFGRLHEE